MKQLIGTLETKAEGLVGKGREIVKVADRSPKISLAGIVRKRDTLLKIVINPKIKLKKKAIEEHKVK